MYQRNISQIYGMRATGSGNDLFILVETASLPVHGLIPRMDIKVTRFLTWRRASNLNAVN